MTAWLTIKKFLSLKVNTIFDTVSILLILIVSVFYFIGIKTVPFHPDESTQIFMSSDFIQFFKNPQTLFWFQQDSADIRQQYRELDAPMTRYVIGFGRWITSTPPLKSDWNWSQSWEINISNDAMPSEKQLLVSRFSIAAIFPFTLLFIYLTGIKIQGRITGLAALLFFSSNALILLHTRRAMAESLLVFFSIISIYFVFSARSKLWLAAVPIALAINSKQTALFLVFGAIFAILWFGIKSKTKSSKIFLNLVFFLVTLGTITFLLNPFLWANPLSAIKSSFQARIDLTNSQIKSFQSISPTLILNTSSKKIAGLIGNLYFQKPAIQDIGNYTQALLPITNTYLANPFNTMLRSTIDGVTLLFLSISGFIFGLYKIIKKKDLSSNLILLALLSISALVIHLVSIQLPFQRYVIIFVPIYIFWISYLVSNFIAALIGKTRKTPAPAGAGVNR